MAGSRHLRKSRSDLTHCGTSVVSEMCIDRPSTVLYRFCSRTNCGDGALPDAGLVFDLAGNL
jgi:hypothetical protein